MSALSKCRITVIRRSVDRELIEQFLEDDHTGMAPCDMFTDGQKFIVDQIYQPPKGFCPWAWADIRHAIARIAAGGDFPGMREKGVEVAGCTDWFRPVLFKIERAE